MPQGVVAEFGVQLPAGALRKGANKITVAAITDGFSGSGDGRFRGECSNANAVAHVNEEGAGITVIATVANAGSSPLANVTLDFKAFRKVELFERRCIRYRRRRGERHRAHPPQLGSRGRAGDNRQEQRRGSGARKAAGGEQAPVDNRCSRRLARTPVDNRGGNSVLHRSGILLQRKNW